MNRYLGTLLLICCIYIASGQPAGLLHSSFATKFRYVDSLNRTLPKDNNTRDLVLIDKQELLAREANDIELSILLKLLSTNKKVLSKAITGAEGEKLFLMDIERARENKMPYAEANALQALGEFYSETERSSFGFEHFLSAYLIYSGFTAKEFPPKEYFLYQLGSSYYRYGDNENALKYIKEAVMQPTFILRSGFTEFNTIGLSYRNMAKYDSALWYFNAMYNEAKAISDSIWQTIAMGNIGITYYHQKKFKEAIPLLENDIKQCLQHHVIKNAVGSMLILGSLYYEQKEMDKAAAIMQVALSKSRKHSYWYDYAFAERIYTLLFKIYAAKNIPGLATLYADSAMIARDSNIAKNNALMFTKKQEKLDMLQRSIANKQLKDQKKVNFFLALVSILLLVIGVLAYLNQRMTAKLNKQIISQKRELENLNEVKDRIFSVISHDMRTPVNSLIAFTELLEKGNITQEKMAAYAAALKNNLGYTARLMENLLNWARTQMQGYNPVLEVFDISETVGQAIETLQHEAGKKQMTISNHVPVNTLVYADMNMCLLIIRNLMSNAIKYTAAGGSVILSSYKVQATLHLVVKDSGIGIGEQQVEMFNNLSSAQPIESTPGTNQEKGTGLGLMLCRKFVTLMHGTIVLESELGKGSSFTVSLPSERSLA